MAEENLGKFIQSFRSSLERGSFVRLTLGQPSAGDDSPVKVQIRPVETKRGERLLFVYRHERRDVTKNLSFEEGAAEVGSLLGRTFLSANLFTTERDFQFQTGRRGDAVLSSSKPSFTERPSLSHDRLKNSIVDPSAPYLAALGITTHDGSIRQKQQDKWRQINKFVEVLDGLFEKSRLKGREELRIADMGAGKGYLTFAAHDHFANRRGLRVRTVGVDERRELVGSCNSLAEACGLDGLSFVEGRIADFDVGKPDILIALHACDTATDDAIFKGVTGEAELIVTSPCCHKEVRRQIKVPTVLAGVLRHGILLEREAESVTDGLRAMLLESRGYEARVFEFVGSEHTPKNNMLVGVKSDTGPTDGGIAEEIANLKAFYGIEHQRLDSLLNP